MNKFRLFIQVLIIYSIATLTLQSMPEMRQYSAFFRVSEIIVVTIFTVEYFINWFICRKWTFPLQPMAIIDLLAILPFYLQFGVDLRGLRALRLLRVFRLLKLGRYSKSLQMLGEAAKRAAPDLLMFGFVGLIVIFISAMCLYYVENEAQPDVYSSIPASFWWAIVTLTTVGYGDAYPTTAIGKVVASVIMLVGIGFIAIPTSIVTTTLADIHREERAAPRQM